MSLENKFQNRKDVFYVVEMKCQRAAWSKTNNKARDLRTISHTYVWVYHCTLCNAYVYPSIPKQFQ